MTKGHPVHPRTRLAALALPCILSARIAAAETTTPLRVCADPDNLPFSNEKGEGFENKIAEVVARDLGMPLSYFWWPHQRGLVRRTLGEDKCDVLIGVPRDYERVLTTRAYYRSTYVIAFRKGAQVPVRSLDDPELKHLRIGVHIDTPPWSALGERGLMEHVQGYPLMFDYRTSAPEQRPDRLLQDLADGVLDVAFVWGPMAGWFAKSHRAPLELVPLRDTSSALGRMSFDVSMGVKKSDGELKTRLETALAHRDAEIKKILAEYGIPTLPAEQH